MNNEVTLKSLQQQIAQITSLLLTQKEVLTIEECCLYMGLSKAYLYKLTHFRQIPFYKPNGKKIYFKRTEINSWLLNNKSLSDEEMETAAANHVVGL
ncbi:excisionase family DNA-binding protein [Candidatus Williamhamiltonella defendens]|uniref:Excisionase n=1 Tax=Candidatus Hamiltonella defensa (Bemisia tabaci) TaxID=672795 RepID=A0A249DWG9_9ENTR|nr:excisionase family DNA-binding protein [Candidatus Hamiltonella defensa]ASX25896.1 excisionase [Candidatus Hamiltonella defensa (Bemisia tabaci)]AYB49582.1 DNA-binding protein [Candidatus Hamiltonella defensa]